VINGQRRRVLRKKEVMMVLCWEKPFSPKNGNVQPYRYHGEKISVREIFTSTMLLIEILLLLLINLIFNLFFH
jgi:hypothetical protein